MFKSEFSKNVLTLMTGTVIAQAIPIAITPILTRLYTPEDFGVLSLFLSVLAITGVIANARYEHAIVTTQNENSALSIFVLGLLLSFLFSLFLILLILIFKSNILIILNSETNSKWIYFIPIATFLVGLNNMLSFYNLRVKSFKNKSISIVTKSSTMSVGQIGLGFFNLGSFGLIIGHVFSLFSGNMILFKSLRKNKHLFKEVTRRTVIQQAVQNRKYPMYSLPGALLNTAYLNLTNVLISFFYSLSILGFYSLGKRLIGMPSMIVGSNISQVYFQQISEANNIKKATTQIFHKTLIKLIFLSLPVYIVLFIVAEPLFEFVFGQEWRVAGTYAKYLLPLSFFRLISSTFSSTLLVYDKQELTFIIQVVQIVALAALFYFVKLYSIDFTVLLLYYTIIFSLIYISSLFVYWRIAKLKSHKL